VRVNAIGAHEQSRCSGRDGRAKVRNGVDWTEIAALLTTSCTASIAAEARDALGQPKAHAHELTGTRENAHNAQNDLYRL
jgi:hypothetical protein